MIASTYRLRFKVRNNANLMPSRLKPKEMGVSGIEPLSYPF